MAREFKDSGIEWIGQIPREWSVELIGNNIKEINDKNDDSSEDNALQFKMGSIISKKGGDSKYNPESLAAYTKVKEGDIVINGLNLSFDLISQRVGLVREKGVITSTYLTLRPSSLLHSVFVNYLFKAYDNCKAFHGMGRGLRQILAYRELKNQKLIYPPLPEQQKIADYLDKVCGEVDEMVALQETMIEELKAYKQSVITEAVTKGLNPNVPMRHSGIDWIGEIPEHWEVRRLKEVFILKTGTTPKEYDKGLEHGSLINWFTPSDIDEMNCELNGSQRYLSKEVAQNEGIQLYPKGSLIFVGIGASAGKIGYANVEGYSNQQITAIIPRNAHCYSKYFYYYMIADRKRIRDNAFFTTLPIINNSYLSGVKVLFPAIEEQRAIASYLDTKCSEIDSLIALKQAKIDELKEYKKSVIYEYVTGKREVV